MDSPKGGLALNERALNFTREFIPRYIGKNTTLDKAFEIFNNLKSLGYNAELIPFYNLKGSNYVEEFIKKNNIKNLNIYEIIDF